MEHRESKQATQSMGIPSDIVITIDGGASSGKSTFARALAEALGYLHIDSGAMYRAVTLACLRAGLTTAQSITEERVGTVLETSTVGFMRGDVGEPLVTLNGEVVEGSIRGGAVDGLVSHVASLACVRSVLTQQQQALGAAGGVVMDGRDIGTAVFPEAECKIFLTASIEERAKRRYHELLAKGQQVTLEQVKEQLKLRDTLDSSRALSPLRQAEDALVLDNSTLTVPEQVAWVLAHLRTLCTKEKP